MAHVVTLIPGDGIGPEVTKSVVEILESTGVAFEWERVEAGAAVFERTGEALSIEVIEACKKNGVALKGPIGTPIAKGFQSVNVRLREPCQVGKAIALIAYVQRDGVARFARRGADRQQLAHAVSNAALGVRRSAIAAHR